MGCKHRFYDELNIQKTDLEYLFIGTFNPEWNAKNGNNAEYFYGRETNQFWCILPHAFNENCLIDKGRKEWENFCLKYKIGLTDLVKCVNNVNINIEKHYKDLTGYIDSNLENYFLEFNTSEIIKIINNNHSLKGVYFTRKSCNNISNIWDNWLNIKSQCIISGIKIVAELPSPSCSTKKISIIKKIKIYKEMISIN